MKKAALLFLCAIISFSVNAKKMYVSLEVMAGSADLIVVGEIVEVKSNTYLFKITKTLKGNKTGTITVEKFREWTCDTRYQPCTKGEKLVLFLEQGAAHWTIINGSTGEKPIIKGKIARTAYYYEDLGKEYLLDSDTFIKAVAGFVKCFTYVGNIYREGHFKQLVSDSLIDQFANYSPLCKEMVSRVKNTAGLVKQ